MKETINKNDSFINDTFYRAADFSKSAITGLVDLCQFATEDSVKILGFKRLIIDKIFKGGIIPLISKTLEFKYSELNELFSAIIFAGQGSGDINNYISDINEKLLSGIRYDFLVNKLGKELFGSAKFQGEVKICENDFFTLTFIPAKKQNNNNAALFHVGGMLPYSDRVFRLIDEANFYAPFIENGISVYAMEVKGEASHNPHLKNLTLTKMLETIHEFTDIAFKHNNDNKLILEGYCGLAMPAVCSFLSDKVNMEKKIGSIALFVAPIDGRKCEKLSEMIDYIPRSFVFSFFLFNSIMGTPIDGKNIGSSIDLVTQSFIEKSVLGRFFTGWKSRKYADINSIEELDKSMRVELAGAYWISPDSAKRFPVPVSLSNFSTMLFTQGISSKGEIPFKFKGETLNLNDLKKSNIPVIGFYGADDPMITENSAEILKQLLGDQYTHVVHQKTGHISYVFSQNRWDEKNEKSFKPGIISTILERFNK